MTKVTYNKNKKCFISESQSMIIMEGCMAAVRETRELTSDPQIGSRDCETRPVVGF